MAEKPYDSQPIQFLPPNSLCKNCTDMKFHIARQALAEKEQQRKRLLDPILLLILAILVMSMMGMVQFIATNYAMNSYTCNFVGPLTAGSISQLKSQAIPQGIPLGSDM